MAFSPIEIMEIAALRAFACPSKGIKPTNKAMITASAAGPRACGDLCSHIFHDRASMGRFQVNHIRTIACRGLPRFDASQLRVPERKAEIVSDVGFESVVLAAVSSFSKFFGAGANR